MSNFTVSDRMSGFHYVLDENGHRLQQPHYLAGPFGTRERAEAFIEHFQELEGRKAELDKAGPDEPRKRQTDVEERLTGSLENYHTDDLLHLIQRAQEELAKRNILTVEIRAMPMGEHQYGATDTACEVRVDGKLIGYGDDYGTFRYPNDGIAPSELEDHAEKAIDAAVELWADLPR